MPSRFPFIRGCNGRFSDDWLIGLFMIGLLDDLWIGWSINWMIDWLIGWLIDRLDYLMERVTMDRIRNDWLNGRMIDWLDDWLIDWMVNWFIYSLIYRYLLVIYWWLGEVDLLIQETNIISFLFFHDHKILVQERKKLKLSESYFCGTLV